MKKLVYITLFVLVALSSCKTVSVSRAERYPKMYEEQPNVIVVLPPINRTTHVEAKEALYTSISTVLIERGYYVCSPYLTAEFLKAESGYDSELFFDQNLGQFGNIFGADAVLFTIIEKWEKVGFGIQTDIRYVIRSTKTNEMLFDRRCDLYLDLSTDTGAGTSNAIANLIISTINTAVTKHITAGRKCNYFIFNDLPVGKYHPMYNTDRDLGTYEPNIKATVR